MALIIRNQLRSRFLLRASQNAVPTTVVISQKRLQNDLAAPKVDSLDICNTSIKLKTSSWPHQISLNHLWLRDHCRCNKCYNYATNQRILDLLSIPSDISPIKCYMEDKNFVVLWSDKHSSKYSVDWLWQNSHDGFRRKIHLTNPILWNNKGIADKVASVNLCDYMNNEASIKKFMKSIVDYGVGIVENVQPTTEATEEVVRRIAHVQQTFFGGMWEFSNKMAHNDTAYTSQALGAHTDNTYFNEAAGLQVFHCFQHDGTGGENLLVDGFRAANDLHKTHGDSYDLLTSTPIESEYLEPGQHFSATAPVLRLNPLTHRLEQVRFNLYDRAPMSALPDDKVSSFYKALIRLAETIRDPQGEWWIKLKPGNVLFIDNWRVLHGRASYTGYRRMGGCYLNRSDFLSKARIFGLI